ncbi:hypothetical protein CUROG_01190 [Corynebacterium urogenitale]|uniref:Secreted protein n=1 Tax=Corynebacterium urogenitale TaxID=2487892 RepID=A0A5J6Z8I4_9CORY|nr:hypothetical protein [Corynebacterium urogenitale]QFQ01639.1 hypothetical protein CUROG_01190 [Corynebacterium urogenitale]
MKNLRKAALAVATASAVAFAGTSVAGAQTEDENNALTQISSEGESSLAGNEEGESSLAGKEEAESAPADEEQGGSSLSSDEQSEDASGSSNFLSRIGKVLGADQYVNGAQLWGFQQGENLPPWAVLFKVGTIVGVIGTIAGAVIAGINGLKNMGLIKDGQ